MKNRSIVAGLARWSFSRLGQRSRNSAAMLDSISSNQSRTWGKYIFRCAVTRFEQRVFSCTNFRRSYEKLQCARFRRVWIKAAEFVTVEREDFQTGAWHRGDRPSLPKAESSSGS